MSRYGYDSDYNKGRRDCELNGRYGYDVDRYLYGNDRDDRDYREGFNEVRRELERREEALEQERQERERHEREAAERRWQAEEEEADWRAAQEAEEHQE